MKVEMIPVGVDKRILEAVATRLTTVVEDILMLQKVIVVSGLKKE